MSGRLITSSGARIIDGLAIQAYVVMQDLLSPEPPEVSSIDLTAEHSTAAFEAYLGVFSEPSVLERERLLRANVDNDVIFSNPGVEGRGVDELLGHVARFQALFPGSRFRINWVRRQHGRLLAEWTQLNGDGSEFLTAHSYAQLDAAGRIVQFAGFWD